MKTPVLSAVLLRITAGLLLAFCSFLPVTKASADTEYGVKVRDAMKQLQGKAAALGAAKLDGTNLFFGDKKMNGNYTIVDEIKSLTGATATFFVKKGVDFMRVSTNVVKDDGNRAVGTILDPNGLAIKAISNGEAFYGIVDILGKKYDTGYEPIKSPSNEVVGVYYVGYLLDK